MGTFGARSLSTCCIGVSTHCEWLYFRRATYLRCLFVCFYFNTELLKSADLKTQNRFKNYKPAVSHGNTRKIIGIKRAGDRYLEGLIMLRETSQEDEVVEDVNASHI